MGKLFWRTSLKVSGHQPHDSVLYSREALDTRFENEHHRSVSTALDITEQGSCNHTASPEMPGVSTHSGWLLAGLAHVQEYVQG